MRHVSEQREDIIRRIRHKCCLISFDTRRGQNLFDKRRKYNVNDQVKPLSENVNDEVKPLSENVNEQVTPPV